MQKRVFAAAAAIALTLTACSSSEADDESADFPSQPIEFIIPYDAGGGSDVSARQLVALLEPELGVTVTPVNLPGGSGAVGLAELQGREPDGYTAMVITSSISALKPLGTSPYGSEDFDIVATVQAEPYGIAVKEDSPYETFEDLVAAAAEEPLDVGTTAVGGNNFLAATVVGQTADADFNLVPYDGGAAQAVTDAAGGVLDATFASPSELRAQREAGNIRVLAVTADERLDAMPDVPTFSELGVDVIFETVRLILVPKGTPADRIDVLEAALEKAVNDPTFVEAMESGGSVARFVNSEDSRTFVQEQDAQYLELLKDAGLVD